MHTNFNGSRVYGLIALAGFFAAACLVIVVPDRFKEPDDWAYRAAVENFSQGRLTVDSTLHQQQVTAASHDGGQLVQYVQIGPDEWAFEKAPGYVYFLVPFYLIGFPQLANILLAAALALVIYLLLKELVNEKTACLGVLLILFTPAGLAMLQREYIDGFASAATTGIGGGLYIYYCLKSATLKPKASAALLFSTGFFLAAAIAVRYTDAVVVAVLGLHFVVTRLGMLKRGRRGEVVRETLLLGAGALIPLSLLLWYHQTVFGSPFAYGYEYTRLNVKFAYDYIGDPRSWQIILENLKKMPGPILTGFPFLVLTIPAIVISILQKAKTKIGQNRSTPTLGWSTLKPNLFWLLLGWLVAVFGLYLMYEWTANQRVTGQPFIILARFYLPALLPMALFAALLVGRISVRIAFALVITAMILGGIVFGQASSQTLHAGGPGQQTPKPPLGQLAPVELAKLIERTRQEVEAIPTNQSNFKLRFDVLIRWIGELNKSGYAVGRVVPAAEVNRIQDLIKSGDVGQASVLIDMAYARLESLISN